jgi:hypothetical protein
MPHSSTSICENHRLDPNEQIIFDDNMLNRYGYIGKASIQGIAKNGDVEVTITYSNHSKLEYKILEKITFANGVDKHQALSNGNFLIPFKHIRYIVENKSTTVVYLTLVPCFI